MNKEMYESQSRTEQQEYKYFAFISYSHKDMKWARWLQKKLESYKLPSKLQETDSRNGKKTPNPIQPVFRDETSINPGKSVDDALRSELEKSKYLITICSHASSTSTWVNREVERFVEMGREDRIMPFIIEGIPHSQNPKKECYVPALRALAEKKGSSILGADVQARGKREAFLCTVAFLLGIDLETLRSREAERRRRKRITFFAVSAAFLAIFAFAGFKAWDYFVPKVFYYQDYTMRYGIPEGLYALNKQQIKTRQEHYEITTKYGKVQSLAHKNQYGTITDGIDSEMPYVSAYMTFSYDERGALISSTRYKANGKPVVTWKYTENLKIVQFEYPETVTHDNDGPNYSGSIAMTLEANTLSMESDIYWGSTIRSSIAGYIFTYNDDGLIREEYFSDMPTFGRKTKDADGIWGHRYEYNSFGQITRIQYLSEDGKLLTAKNGVAQKVFSYDQDGFDYKIECQNASGKLVMNEEGWAIDIAEFESGNIIAEETRDTEGNLVINNDGWARLNWIYDEKGNCVEMYSTGVNGEPIIDITGRHKWTFSYDEFGREIERKGYDTKGKLTVCSDGYASCRYSYDQSGNWIGMICYDENGNRVACLDGAASWIAAYNDRGEMIEIRYYDETDAPTLCDAGYATVKLTLDNHGNPIIFSYFGTNGEPILNNDGAAVLKCKYDELGNEIERTFYDTAGNLSNCNHGFAKLTFTFDKQGHLIEIAYYDEHGEPVLVGFGYSILHYQYDNKGNNVETSFHGQDGQLIMVSAGYAGWTSKYDEFGNEVERCYYDTDKEPTATHEGYAMWQIKFDAVNNLIDICYFDEDGNKFEQVAFTDLSICFPNNWEYADRSISENSFFCTSWGMTTKEFIDLFLTDDCYAFAVDTITDATFLLYVNATDQNDYSEMNIAQLSRPEQIKLLAEMAEQLNYTSREEIKSKEIVFWKVPFFKAVTTDNLMTNYYYETVSNSKRITFLFMVETAKWDSSFEQVYRRIVKNAFLESSQD